MRQSLLEQLRPLIRRLTPEDQLELIKLLADELHRPAVSNRKGRLARHCGTLSPQVAREMNELIAAECERIDPDGW